MTENMTDILRKHLLRWLGHLLERMDSSRLSKQLLFGELTKTRPRHGLIRCWRGLAVMDVRALRIKRDWYKIVQDRKQWLNVCETSIFPKQLPAQQKWGKHQENG